MGLYHQPPRDVVFYDNLFPLPWVQAVLLIWSPASFIARFALIAWAIRLVVLYDPAKRKRWGHLTKEVVIFRALGWSYATIQGMAWLAVSICGLQV